MEHAPDTPEDVSISSVVESFDGIPIYFDLYEGGGDGLVLVVPGFWRDRRHPSMKRLGNFLAGYGYNVAIIDVRGHGESGGTYGFNLHEHHDVYAVAAELQRRGLYNRASLLGFSVGGAIAVATAACHDLPLRSLILISSVAEFSMIAPRLNPLHMRRHIAFSQAFRRPRFDWRFMKSEKRKATEDIRTLHMPVCLLHVKNDWLIGHPHSVALYENANEPKELHIIDIPGNYHADRIFSAAGDEVEPMMLAFLKKTLA